MPRPEQCGDGVFSGTTKRSLAEQFEFGGDPRMFERRAKER